MREITEAAKDITIPPTEFEVSELLGILTGTGSSQFALTLRRLAFQRDALAAKVAELRKWKDALVDGVVVAGIYATEHETNPRKALNDLQCREHKVALDPAVSEESKKLHGDIEELRKVVQQALNVELQIHPGDTTRGPHDGMIARYEDVLRKTASVDAVQPATEGGGA